MSFMSDYEKRMLKNREENKKVLASLGLDRPFFPISNAQRKVPAKQGTKRKRSENENSRKAQRTSADSVQTRELVQSSEEDWRIKYGRRRSGRLMGKEPSDFQGLSFEEEYEEEEEKPKRTPRNRENVFGQIPGIEVGTTWSTRLECSADGVHRPTVAGIHGNASEGCYSLALSGGYEDDVDYGDCFTYTGEGGRDLKGTKSNPKNLRTAPQSKDQTLTRGNLALTKNVEKGRPVRVIRGYKLDSPFAPEEGYRYDGLYTVEKYWQSVGLSGYMVYKFALKRSDNQPPAVWHASKDEDESAVEEDSEDMEQDNTVSPCSTPSEDNKDPAEKSGQNNNTDGGDGKTNENGADDNGADVKSTQHDDKNNTAVHASSDESVERTDNESKQDGGGYDAAGDNEDDDHVNTTSGQHDDGNEQTNVKATQGENDDDDDNDEHHVTNAIQQEDSNKQTNIKATQGENDDADDEHHVTNAIQQEDNDKTSEAKATQGENDDADNNDEHHVINAIQQEDNDKTSEAKATQDDVNDDDKNPVKNAAQDPNSD